MLSSMLSLLALDIYYSLWTRSGHPPLAALDADAVLDAVLDIH